MGGGNIIFREEGQCDGEEPILAVPRSTHNVSDPHDQVHSNGPLHLRHLPINESLRGRGGASMRELGGNRGMMMADSKGRMVEVIRS